VVGLTRGAEETPEAGPTTSSSAPPSTTAPPPTTAAPQTIDLFPPDYLYRPVAEVQAELEALGLQVELEPVDTGGVFPGQVLAVRPTSDLPPGSVVTVTHGAVPRGGGGQGNEGRGNGNEGGGNGNEGNGNEGNRGGDGDGDGEDGGDDD
jgi:serine/threonine-protein kinase